MVVLIISSSRSARSRSARGRRRPRSKRAPVRGARCRRSTSYEVVERPRPGDAGVGQRPRRRADRAHASLELARSVTPVGYVEKLQAQDRARRQPARLRSRPLPRSGRCSAPRRASSGSPLGYVLPAASTCCSMLLAIGFGVGPVVLRPRHRACSSKIERAAHRDPRALPDTLDLLVISVEAGLGFEQALDRTATRCPGRCRKSSAACCRRPGWARAGPTRCARSTSAPTSRTSGRSSSPCCRPTPSVCRSLASCAPRPMRCVCAGAYARAGEVAEGCRSRCCSRWCSASSRRRLFVVVLPGLHPGVRQALDTT